MKTQSFYLKLTLVLVTTALLSACGASKDSANYDSSSRINLVDINTAADGTNRPLAYCNQATNTQLSLAVSTYQDGETVSLTRMNAKVLKIPTSFAQNKTYLEFHKYMISKTGVKSWGTERLAAHIYSIADGKLLASNKKYLYWADLQSAAAKLGVSTPEQFFKKTRIVIELDDVSGDYDALSVIYYDNEDNSVISQLDALIPVFDADPARYAVENDGQTTSTRSLTLQNLHPFKNQTNQGWTAQNYQTKANEFCSPIYTVQ